MIIKPSGYVLMDGEEVATTVSCAHCGKHWVPAPGSGRIRGKCLKCNSLTCGDPACDYCIPLEVKLDVVDGGNVSTLRINKFIDKLNIIHQRFGHIL